MFFIGNHRQEYSVYFSVLTHRVVRVVFNNFIVSLLKTVAIRIYVVAAGEH